MKKDKNIYQKIIILTVIVIDVKYYYYYFNIYQNVEIDKNCIEMLPSVLNNEYEELMNRLEDNEDDEDEIYNKLNNLLNKMRIVFPPEYPLLNEIEEFLEENNS